MSFWRAPHRSLPRSSLAGACHEQERCSPLSVAGRQGRETRVFLAPSLKGDEAPISPPLSPSRNRPPARPTPAPLRGRCVTTLCEASGYGWPTWRIARGEAEAERFFFARCLPPSQPVTSGPFGRGRHSTWGLARLFPGVLRPVGRFLTPRSHVPCTGLPGPGIGQASVAFQAPPSKGWDSGRGVFWPLWGVAGAGVLGLCARFWLRPVSACVERARPARPGPG